MHGLAHITGGGLLENVPRVLPEDSRCVLDGATPGRADPCSTGCRPSGHVADAEMHRVFNCGIGMTVHVAQGADAARALRPLGEAGQPALIGEVRAGTRGVVIE